MVNFALRRRMHKEPGPGLLVDHRNCQVRNRRITLDRINKGLNQRDLSKIPHVGLTPHLTLNELLEVQKRVGQDMQKGGNERAKQRYVNADDLWKASSQIHVPLQTDSEDVT
jgi:hypothetical protein